MTLQSRISQLTLGKKAALVGFVLLTAAFLFRTVQFGYKWLVGTKSPDMNYHVLTLWALVYTLVCGAIAYAIVRLGQPEESETGEGQGSA